MTNQAEIAFNIEALGRWLRERDHTVRPPLRCSRIGQGQSNLTYVIQDAGSQRWVVRRPPLGELLASAHDVAREGRIIAALEHTDVPVPRIVGLIEDEQICARPLLVMEHIDGRVIDGMAEAEQLDGWQRSRLSVGIADVLARLHHIDIDQVGLGDLASRSPYAERQLKRWSRQWEASRTREQPGIDRLTEWLRTHLPAPQETTVVHGDLHLKNVIIDPRDAAIRAVLDWELCTLGEPLADVGTALAYWPEAGDPEVGLFEASTLPGFSTRRELAEEYARLSGRDLTDLPFWEVLGLWKLAIIGEGVRRRALDEPANESASGPPSIESLDGIVQRALETCRG